MREALGTGAEEGAERNESNSTELCWGKWSRCDMETVKQETCLPRCVPPAHRRLSMRLDWGRGDRR